MSNRAKNIIYTCILFVSLFVVFLYRKSQKSPENTAVKLEGSTMGTTYHVTYFDAENRNFKVSIDSLLELFNQSLSTYIPDSEISSFNRDSVGISYGLPFFHPVLKRSKEIFEASENAFDPTVMPLVDAWGFGPGEAMNPDSTQIDSILQFVGLENVDFNGDSVWKNDPRIRLDFSAVAKGYGVDVVADFLRDKGLENFFVEIGGEVVAAGQNLQKESAWTVGILSPNSTYEDQEFFATASLSDKALATSGNYYNYREVDGKKFSHTLDPQSGRPVTREILSASVFANDCMTADAWATACMVMGHQKAIELLGNHKEIDIFLIYSQEDGSLGTFVTPRFASNIKLR